MIDAESTGGWSGNESIIGAMQKNRMVWNFLWEQSRRGGHYVFDKRALHGSRSTPATCSQ